MKAAITRQPPIDTPVKAADAGARSGVGSGGSSGSTGRLRPLRLTPAPGAVVTVAGGSMRTPLPPGRSGAERS